MKEFKSEGKCVYCNETHLQEEMSKHIASHLQKSEKENASKKSTIFHIKVEAAEMFLHLLVSGDATFKNLDKFLRDIWVECCGHLSAFHHKSYKMGMSNNLIDVLSSGMKFGYNYDFGSTTYLELSVLGQYNIQTKKKMELLSRNEPLKLMCATCKKEPAVIICPICYYEKYSLFCEVCSKKHKEECEDFDEDTCLPVVNSPRMGECGYEGGIIDIERDGVYKK